jgi:hypothetical protein
MVLDEDRTVAERWTDKVLSRTEFLKTHGLDGV